jgi:hypothetical protein
MRALFLGEREKHEGKKKRPPTKNYQSTIIMHRTIRKMVRRCF